jgi:hypothetical protein
MYTRQKDREAMKELMKAREKSSFLLPLQLSSFREDDTNTVIIFPRIARRPWLHDNGSKIGIKIQNRLCMKRLKVTILKYFTTV